MYYGVTIATPFCWSGWWMFNVVHRTKKAKTSWYNQYNDTFFAIFEVGVEFVTHFEKYFVRYCLQLLFITMSN